MLTNDRKEKLREKAYKKCVVPFIEKEEKIDETPVHYLFYPNENNTLIIVFQDYHPNGPEYDFLSTLSNIKANKLFIKDDFIETTGNFYLGHDFTTEQKIHQLIQRFKDQTQATKLVFIGSGKGGYAAVNFGIAYSGSVMIASAPQYYLGEYMYRTETKYCPALEQIVDEPITQDKLELLNNHLKIKLTVNPYSKTQRAYIYCNVNEKTYTEHVVDMIQDMKEAGVKVNSDIAEYHEKNESRYYFPEYILSTLRWEGLINDKNKYQKRKPPKQPKPKKEKKHLFTLRRKQTIRLYIAMMLSIPKSIWFCLLCFPLGTAIKIPILISYKTKVLHAFKGCIEIQGDIKPFMIKIGFGGSVKIPARKSAVCLEKGTVIFQGSAVFSDGIALSNSGKLRIGDNFLCNHNCTIWCKTGISIGKDCLVGWDVTICDHDKHKVWRDGVRTNEKPRRIIVGRHVWLCSKVTLLQGAGIKEGSIVAFNALVNKRFKDSHILLAGIPAKKKKENVEWAM